MNTAVDSAAAARVVGTVPMPCISLAFHPWPAHTYLWWVEGVCFLSSLGFDGRFIMTECLQKLTNCSLAGLAVLAILFMFSASLSGQGTAPALASNLATAGANWPPQVPEDFVITPFGYFHPSCVLRIEEGDTLLADGRVRHADGMVDANVPVCNYPHYTPAGVLVPTDVRAASGAYKPIIRGWLEYVSATTSTSYGEITATWTVPPQPATNDGQILFFFPGLEDINDVISILQPVLQFGQSAAGGGNYWAVASWNCCITGVAWYSPLLKVSPGDTILGEIIPMCKKGLEYCANWKVISEDETTGKKRTLSKTPAEGQVWNWGFGAVLEVYRVQQCSDFPANNSIVFTVQLYDQNRNLIANPGWTGTPAGSGTSPWCNYDLSVTSTQETLEY